MSEEPVGHEITLHYFGPRPVEEVMDLISEAICVGPAGDDPNCRCQFTMSYKPIADNE